MRSFQRGLRYVSACGDMSPVLPAAESSRMWVKGDTGLYVTTSANCGLLCAFSLGLDILGNTIFTLIATTIVAAKGLLEADWLTLR